MNKSDFAFLLPKIHWIRKTVCYREAEWFKMRGMIRGIFNISGKRYRHEWRDHDVQL